MPDGRLLILDDDATVGQILLTAAQVAGFAARLCDQADDFVAALAAWDPTHVAIDLGLPGTSGEEVIRRIAAAGCRARVIVCSGAGSADQEAALATARSLGLATAGALSKPFRLAALRALLAPPG